MDCVFGRRSWNPDEEMDVWKMRSDGTDAINLTPNFPGNDSFLSFSRDGKQIVFRSGREAGFDHAYRLKAALNIRFTHNKWEEGVPSWQAGG